MFKKLLFFLFLTLALLIVKAPASLLDGLVAHFTGDGLRLQQAEGSLWHGRGVLASRDASGRSLSPWLPLAWDFDAGALGHLAVAWTLSSSGSPVGTVEAGIQGLTVSKLALHAPANTALSPIPHPVARAGWQGDLTIESPRWQCPADGKCSGEARLLWRGARSALFPGRQFGDYDIRVTAQAGHLRYTVQTLAGEVIVNGQGEAPYGQMPRFDGTISGDPDFLGRLPAIAGGAATPTGRPGQFAIHWPPH
jgi:hypothetical protein